MNKKVDYVLPMDLGDFHTTIVFTASKIRKMADKFLKNENKEEWFEQIENGVTSYDELLIANYDYNTGGIGSIYIYFDLEDEKYVLATELNGNTKDVSSYDLGKEKELLQGLIETAQEKTIKWAS